MIIGIGVDICSIMRFEAMITRRPGMIDRLFSPAESTTAGKLRTSASLAARFAAKEALAKALGVPSGVGWLDVEVLSAETGAPQVVARGRLEEVLRARGVERVHLSLSHDADCAIAMVVCEGVR